MKCSRIWLYISSYSMYINYFDTVCYLCRKLTTIIEVYNNIIVL